MKNKVLITAAICLALVALVRSVGKPVLAQVRAALTQSVDEPGRNAFNLQGSGSTSQLGSTAFTVPAGKRYVIDQYTASCSVISSTSMSQLSILAFVGPTVALHTTTAHLVSPVGGGGAYSWAATGAGPIYVDPGTAFGLNANTAAGGLHDITSCQFYVTGHSINLP